MKSFTTGQIVAIFFFGVISGATLYSFYVKSECDKNRFFRVGTGHYECMKYKPGSIK